MVHDTFWGWPMLYNYSITTYIVMLTHLLTERSRRLFSRELLIYLHFCHPCSNSLNAWADGQRLKQWPKLEPSEALFVWKILMSHPFSLCGRERRIKRLKLQKTVPHLLLFHSHLWRFLLLALLLHSLLWLSEPWNALMKCAVVVPSLVQNLPHMTYSRCCRFASFSVAPLCCV